MSSTSSSSLDAGSMGAYGFPNNFSHGHSVQFYSDDSFLLEGLGRHIGSALGAGDSAIVIATGSHREGLARRLQGYGVDIELAIRQGRFITLDAAETLKKFMADGWPDAERFNSLIGQMIEQVRAKALGEKPRVAAFGEMVALLWKEGNSEAALRLEQLWNELAAQKDFHLHCAYPLNFFSREQDAALIQKICSEHTHVIPGEGYTALAKEEDRLRAIILLQQKAQALNGEIAERKKIESRLQLQEAALRDFIENAVVGMHWVAADGTILWANQAELQLLGYSREEYVGHHISEFHVDAQVIVDILARLGRNEQLHGYEARLRHKDGSIRYVNVHSNVFTEAGKFVHTRCFTIDVTGQKKGDEARLKLAAVVDSCEDAVVSKDLNGIVTSWNAGAQRIFGYKPEEIIGKSIITIIPPELHGDEPVILSKIGRGERIEHFETVRVTKSGERIDVSLTVSPVKDEDGRVIGVAKIARDITEKKKIEKALRMTEKLASVGRLAATVAHEVNNPLEAITNLIYLAKRDIGDSAKVKERLELASHELDRVAHITRQTLAFYRDTSSEGMVDISQTLDELLFLYEKKLQVRSIRVVKEYRSPGLVSAMAGELRQVFSNLIVNSIDAMPEGGTLTLRIAPSHEWDNGAAPGVRVTVADTGCGIAPEHMKHIFEPFYTTKKDVGTGLGLWITRGIVEKRGGNIQVRSRSQGENGTVFSIFLPEKAPGMAGSPSIREQVLA